MKISRDLSSTELIKKLSKLGYEMSRQRGSHIRLTRFHENEIAHSITIPAHDPIRIGTLSSILLSISNHLGVSKSELLILIENN